MAYKGTSLKVTSEIVTSNVSTRNESKGVVSVLPGSVLDTVCLNRDCRYSIHTCTVCSFSLSEVENTLGLEYGLVMFVFIIPLANNRAHLTILLNFAQ